MWTLSLQEIPEIHRNILTIIGYVFVYQYHWCSCWLQLYHLCCLSKRVCVCESSLEWILFVSRSLWNMRNYIHCMLCANLIAAQLVFIVGVERTENEVKSVLLSLIIHSPAHCRLSVQPLLCCSTTCSWWCSCGC